MKISIEQYLRLASAGQSVQALSSALYSVIGEALRSPEHTLTADEARKVMANLDRTHPTVAGVNPSPWQLVANDSEILEAKLSDASRSRCVMWDLFRASGFDAADLGLW